jgi:hypothetical protein
MEVVARNQGKVGVDCREDESLGLFFWAAAWEQKREDTGRWNG